LYGTIGAECEDVIEILNERHNSEVNIIKTAGASTDDEYVVEGGHCH